MNFSKHFSRSKSLDSQTPDFSEDENNRSADVIKKNSELELEADTKKYMEDMKKGSYNILVAVRARPLTQKESEFSKKEIIKIIDKKLVILFDPFEYNGHSEVFKNRSREQKYAFDFAFDRFCDQRMVFNNTTRFLLEGVINGYNATVFAYGATGAGKTFTMLGNEENPGIMILTLEELFIKIEQNSFDKEYNVKLSYLEIYNENLRDLLGHSEDNLEIREDPQKGLIVAGITDINVSSWKDIMTLLKKGNKNRTTESTNANEASSRSHAILQVSVEHKEKNSGMESLLKLGKLSLIDLAGSERASATQNRGIRLIEGANINRSLLTLGNCINALFEANVKGSKNYVPFRDSKLTRLLKDSLGGNSRTVMIANISPSASCFDDTSNTLKYANRAKNIKTHLNRNVLNVQYHISNYDEVIKNLKSEINELRNALTKSGSNKNVSNYNLITSNSSQIIFDKTVSDLKKLFGEEANIRANLMEKYLFINSQIREVDSSEDSIDEKIEKIKREIDNDEEVLNDMINKRENLLNSAINSLKEKDPLIDQLKMFYSNQKQKLEVNELQFKVSSGDNSIRIYQQLIEEYEKQIRIRDKIIKNECENPNFEKYSNYKNLNQIKTTNKMIFSKNKGNVSVLLKSDLSTNKLKSNKNIVKLPLIHNQVSSAKAKFSSNQNNSKQARNDKSLNKNYQSQPNEVSLPDLRSRIKTNQSKINPRKEYSSLDKSGISNASIRDHSELAGDESSLRQINLKNQIHKVSYASPGLKRNNLPNYPKLMINNNVNNIYVGKEFTPFKKKKDLNVFYNEKMKFRKELKKPFK